MTGSGHFGRAVAAYALYYFPDLAVSARRG